MIFAARQKIRFRGRDHPHRALEFAREFRGECGENGFSTTVTLQHDIEIKPRILCDFGILIGPELHEAVSEDGFCKNGHHDMEKTKRTEEAGV
jgi:hypothetical protein